MPDIHRESEAKALGARVRRRAVRGPRTLSRKGPGFPGLAPKGSGGLRLPGAAFPRLGASVRWW